MKMNLFIALILAAAPDNVITEESSVMQIRQSFVPAAISVKAGDVVSFLNADDVNHNLYSITPSGVRVDYGLQKPGEMSKLTFDSAGLYTVMCNIHPKMKMKVTAQ
jgi:plastocyanin